MTENSELEEPETAVDELREWLEQGGELEAAKAVLFCELRTHYVDELMELTGDRMWSLYDVEIAAPRRIYDVEDEATKGIRKQIEKAVQANAEANGVVIRSLGWIARLETEVRNMGSVVLHSSYGAGDFEVTGEAMKHRVTEDIFLNTRRILAARNQKDALDLLKNTPFGIYPASNHFNDRFYVLLANVPLDRYERFREAHKEFRLAASQLVEAAMEADAPNLRFVAIELELVETGKWSVFLCHASEDKELIVEPVASHLEESGIRCWYDTAEILWGDSIVEKIEEGLVKSEYVVVVVSEHLAKKPWAKKELRTALTMEIGGDGGMVLPLLAGDPEIVLAELPFLREKRYLQWKGDPAGISQELQKRRRLRSN